MSVSQIPRCPTHGTVLTPSGECTLCQRRSVAAGAAAGVPLWAKALGGATLFVALVGVASLIYNYVREDPTVATGEVVSDAPADGRHRLHASLPPRVGRRAHFEATYTRRITAVQHGGGRSVGAAPSGAYFRLDATQRIAAVDPQDGITAYEYDVSSLRIGATTAEAEMVLHDALVRVQPRPSGEPIITVDGERLAPAAGGTYEAFQTMTPVRLGMNDDALYGVDTRRALSETWQLNSDTLNRALRLHLHMDNATATGNATFQSLQGTLGELSVTLQVEGARPRHIGMEGVAERYQLSNRESVTLPTQEDGRRNYDVTANSSLRVRVPAAAGTSRIFDFDIIEILHRTNTPLD